MAAAIYILIVGAIGLAVLLWPKSNTKCTSNMTENLVSHQFPTYNRSNSFDNNVEWRFLDRDKCRFWGVAMIAASPLPYALRKYAAIPEWCVVLVETTNITLDSSTSFLLDSWNIVYISVEKRDKLKKTAASAVMPLLQGGDKSLKTIGYLYAIINKAHTIYDFDADHQLIGKRHIPIPGHRFGTPVNRSHVSLRSLANDFNGSVFNALPCFGPNVNTPVWQRGLPLEFIKQQPIVGRDCPALLRNVGVRWENIGVVQFIANIDPDVDQLYRRTHPFPVEFPLHDHRPVLVASPVISPIFVPLNAKSTLYMPNLFWSLLFPISLNAEACDVLRSYIAQRLFPNIQQYAVIYPPVVLRLCKHTEDCELQSKLPDLYLYSQADKLLTLLREYSCSLQSVPECMVDLYSFLQKAGFLQPADVSLAKSWISDLRSAGYNFPKWSSYSDAHAAIVAIESDNIDHETPQFNAKSAPLSSSQSIHQEKVAVTFGS